MILAIVSASGTWLPEALVFGPTNGPEDFQYVVYRAFGEAEDVEGRRRLLRDWNIYIDDFAVSTTPVRKQKKKSAAGDDTPTPLRSTGPPVRASRQQGGSRPQARKSPAMGTRLPSSCSVEPLTSD